MAMHMRSFDTVLRHNKKTLLFCRKRLALSNESKFRCALTEGNPRGGFHFFFIIASFIVIPSLHLAG